MSIRVRWVNGVPNYYESSTGETVRTFAAVQHRYDFLGASLVQPFSTRDTAGGGEAFVADQPGGWYGLSLTSTNEIQLAGLDEANQRCWTLNRNLTFEARIRFSTLPTGSVVAVIGLCADHNAAVNTVSESIWFRVDGSGALTVETDDGTNETSQVSTGVTLIANEEAVLRIECEDPSDVRFYVNGTRVASGTTFDMSTAPALQLQRVARIGKESAATSVGTLELDYLDAWQDRTA